MIGFAVMAADMRICSKPAMGWSVQHSVYETHPIDASAIAWAGPASRRAFGHQE